MAQAVSHRPVVAETPVRSQATSCVNFSQGMWHLDMFSPSTPVSPLRNIHSMLHTYQAAMLFSEIGENRMDKNFDLAHEGLIVLPFALC